ncbi:MAG: hypothetical protein AAGD14_16905 [Planctomycetota bacterium]
MRISVLISAVLLLVPASVAEECVVVAMSPGKSIYAARGKARKKKATEYDREIRVSVANRPKPKGAWFQNDSKMTVVVKAYRPDGSKGLKMLKKKVKANKGVRLPLPSMRVVVYQDRKVLPDKKIATGGPWGGRIVFSKSKKLSGGKRPAQPKITFRNDSNEKVRVHVYNPSQTVISVWKQVVEPGKTAHWKNHGGMWHVKVHTPALMDKLLTKKTVEPNCTVRIYQDHYTRIHKNSGAETHAMAVGPVGDNRAIDGAPTQAWLSFYFIKNDVLWRKVWNARSYPPLRFAGGPVKYSWIDAKSTGVPFAGVGVPALAAAELSNSFHQVFAFARSDEGGLRMRPLYENTGVVWSTKYDTSNSWETVLPGGLVASRPAAVPNGDQRVLVLFRADDGRIRRAHYDAKNDSWGDWSQLGSQTWDHGPAAVWTGSKPGQGSLLVLAVKGGRLHACERPEDGSFGSWQQVHGATHCAGAPSASGSWRRRAVHVAVRATDGTIRVIRRVKGEWTGWSNLGGNLAGDPVMACHY